jgi:hypothetical protein
MTLFIAIILMNHIGGFSGFDYFLVCVLWLIHLGVRVGS